MYFPMLCVFAGIGWRAEVHPRTHPVNELEFDVIIGADGRRNTLAGKKQQKNAWFKISCVKHHENCSPQEHTCGWFTGPNLSSRLSLPLFLPHVVHM